MALFVASQILFGTLRSQLQNLVVNQTRTQESAIAALVNSGSITNPLPLPRSDVSVQVLDRQNNVVASTANIAGQLSLLSSFNSPKSTVSFVSNAKRFALSDPDEADRRAVLVSTVVGSGRGINLSVDSQPVGPTLRLNGSTGTGFS
ncbi:MAG: hypothetical protein M1288_01735, partial [Actinobacteria bacterium]|nr:hypothetical protein [Actinomycetota bacterium]